MRTKRTYYEILGLPRTASLTQIKRRYKELVRKYHPDVAADKETAHRLFIQINEAYEALTDPVRRKAYDEILDMDARNAAQRTAASRPSASSTGTAQTPPRAKTRTASDLLKDAQWSFIQKRFHEAASLCKQALEIDPANARGHSMMGDIFRAQGKINSAIKAYSMALQLNPHDRDAERKLMKMMGKQMSVQTKAAPQVQHVPGPATFAVQNAVGWATVFFLIMLLNVYPGTPVEWLKRYIPPVDMWSWNLVGLMAAASVVVGALLSINGLLNNPDEELVFDANDGNWAVIPTGLILLIGSGFFFVGAAIFYLAFGLIQNSLSRSMLIVFGCVAGVVGMCALMYDPQARNQVLLFGGNVSFLSMLIGWYLGAASKPLSEF